MKNQSQLGTYKKPVNIFEAIKKIGHPKKEAMPPLKEEDKASTDSHRSEFLFPIRMLF